MLRALRFILLFSCLLINLFVFPQKVALVLSGGGSKGIAHIGVLKALEENGIPVDYIAGTSIGAIIGGLYASGYSPHNIENIFLGEDIINWATGDLQDKYIYYFKKQKDNAAWVTAKFDYGNQGWTYSLPANIISPSQMDFAFNEIFAGASAASGYDFDKLFVPFRCVASDITSNKASVISKGDVGLAIRASMTFPFYFKPVKIDNRLMFDGGMYNNFPADVAYNDFNPDFIIGSQVTANEKPPKENDIISQLYNMLMNKSNYSVICDAGIIIKPDLSQNYNILDFGSRKEYIDSGYNAALRQIKNIREFVHVSVSESEISQKRIAFNSLKPPLIIDRININGVNKYQKMYVLSNLQHKSEKVPLAEFKKNYFRLIADKKIQHIFPQLSFNKHTGYYDISLDVTPEKKFAAQFGGIISSNTLNEAFVGLQYNYLSRNAIAVSLNSYFGRFYNSVEASGRMDFSSLMPFYLRASSSYSIWDYFNTQSYFISDKTPGYLVQYDSHSDLSIGIPATNHGKIELGCVVAHLRNDYYQTNYFLRTDTTDKSYFDLFSVNALYDLNSFKKKQFSNQGIHLFNQFRYVTGKEKNYPGSTSLNKIERKKNHTWLQYKLTYENYFKAIGSVRLGLFSQLQLSNQTLFSNYTSSMLAAPAFEPTPDSKTLFNPCFRAFNFGGFGIKTIYLINKNLDFRVEGYVFQPYREILQNVDLSASFGSQLEKRYFMAMAAFIYQTPIGPVSISLNYYDKIEKVQNKFSVVFGFGYVIFNDRAVQ